MSGLSAGLKIMVALQKIAEFKISLVSRNLTPVEIQKCRTAIDQFNMKTKQQREKLKRRLKRIVKEETAK